MARSCLCGIAMASSGYNEQREGEEQAPHPSIDSCHNTLPYAQWDCFVFRRTYRYMIRRHLSRPNQLQTMA